MGLLQGLVPLLQLGQVWRHGGHGARMGLEGVAGCSRDMEGITGCSTEDTDGDGRVWGVLGGDGEVQQGPRQVGGGTGINLSAATAGWVVGESPQQSPAVGVGRSCGCGQELA